MKKRVQKLLNLAGVKINGDKAWDMQVYNPKVYSRVMAEGSLGLGESYMDGWWDAKSLDKFFEKVLHAQLEYKLGLSPALVWDVLKSKFLNLQNKKRAFE
mgnify:FL=1